MYPNFVKIIELETDYDVSEFIDWLLNYKNYPFTIIVDWITYEFRSEIDKLYFIVGFEAAWNYKERL